MSKDNENENPENENEDPETGEEGEGEWFDDEEKFGAFADKLKARLFPESKPDPKPKKLEGGGQEVSPQKAGDTMTELVSALVGGLKSQAREEARGGKESSTTTSKPAARDYTPKTLGERLWGVFYEED